MKMRTGVLNMFLAKNTFETGYGNFEFLYFEIFKE